MSSSQRPLTVLTPQIISPLQVDSPTNPAHDAKELPESKVDAISIDATRLYKARNIIGFRKYNKMHAIVADSLQVYRNIELLMCNRDKALNLAIGQIDDALGVLRRAEFYYFRQCDQIIQYERRKHELDFLKTNVEAYVRNSIQLVDDEIPKLEDCIALDSEWLDHSQYCALANNLKESLRSPGRILSEKHTITLAGNPLVSKILETTLELCEEYTGKSHIKRLLDANEDFAVMRDYYFNKLVPAARSANRAAQEQLAILGSLLVIALDAKTTANTLMARAEEIAKTNRKHHKRDITEEEHALRVFVDNCREYQRTDKQSQTVRRAENTQGTVRQHPKNGSCLPPITPKILAEPWPVWAQTWTGVPTKILRGGRRAYLGEN